MDRIFQTIESQWKSIHPRSGPLNSTTDEDIQLLEAKERRGKTELRTEGTISQTYGKRTSGDQKPFRKLAAESVEEIFSEKTTTDLETDSKVNRSHLGDVITAAKNREGGINTHQKLSSNQHGTRSRTQEPLPSFPRSPEPFAEQRYSKLHGLGTSWAKPLVFPQSGKGKATVEWRDLERLDEGEFLNDNLIGFYLRYLEYQLEQERPEQARKIYFFNTYFFASLTNTPRGKKGINYEAVKKWTRTVDVFGYDYVIVPINESAHWYLAIICNLPALDRNLDQQDDELVDDPDSKAGMSPLDAHDKPFGSSQPQSALARYGENSKVAISDSDADSTRDSFAEMRLEERPEHLRPNNVQASTPRIASSPAQYHEHSQDGKAQEHSESNLKRNTQDPGSPIEVDQNTTEASSSKAQFTAQSPSSGRKGRGKWAPRLQKYEPGRPVIITLDSLGLPHSPTIRILKDYLAQEGKAKRALQYPDDAIKGMTAKGIPLQNNFCDCGLYLLGYLDKLIEDPQSLCRKILQRELDAEKDWPSLNASQKRDQLRANIQSLHTEQENKKRESAKQRGKHHPREIQGDPDPMHAAESLQASSSVPSGGTVEQHPKISRESALKAASRIDQDDSPKDTTSKAIPVIIPSLEELKPKEKLTVLEVPKTTTREDSLVFISEEPVRKGIQREGDSGRSSRRPGEGSPSIPETPPGKGLDENPRSDNVEMLEV